MPPLLSVVVANRNYCTYLPECLDSILRQSYRPLEIVVADDASTDHSPELITEYSLRAPGVVRPLFLEHRAGPSTARHQAILASRGELITTLDSDDLYSDPGKLAREVEVVMDHRDRLGRDVIAFSDIALVDAAGAVKCLVSSYAPVVEGAILEPMLTRSCLIPRDFVLAKTAYLEAGGFAPELHMYEDWDLKLRLASRLEFFFTGVTGTCYRRHGEGLSAMPLEENIGHLRAVFDRNSTLVAPERRAEVRLAFESFVTRLRESERAST